MKAWDDMGERERDEAVAHYVMGWEDVPDDDVPCYCGDFDAMWSVWLRVQKKWPSHARWAFNRALYGYASRSRSRPGNQREGNLSTLLWLIPQHPEWIARAALDACRQYPGGRVPLPSSKENRDDAVGAT